MDALLIAPVWPSQVWFPIVLELHVDGRSNPILPETHDIITDMNSNSHPLVVQGHLPLAAWPISGRSSAHEVYQRELSRPSINHGEVQQSRHTALHGTSGAICVMNGDYIPFLLSEYEAGKQYWTLNAIRSANSITLEEIGGVCVGQHELIQFYHYNTVKTICLISMAVFTLYKRRK